MSEDAAAVDLIKLALSGGSFLLALVGGVVFRDRQLSKGISDCNTNTHVRIDDLKDDINANFARKDDMKESIRRVERSIDGLGAELRENHKALTVLIVNEVKK